MFGPKDTLADKRSLFASKYAAVRGDRDLSARLATAPKRLTCRTDQIDHDVDQIDHDLDQIDHDLDHIYHDLDQIIS